MNDEEYHALSRLLVADCDRVEQEAVARREKNPPKKKRAKCDCHAGYICARHRGEEQ
jgi:hypothetical protein